MTSSLPSYLGPGDLDPWRMFLEQIERVTPHLGAAAAQAFSGAGTVGPSSGAFHCA